MSENIIAVETRPGDVIRIYGAEWRVEMVQVQGGETDNLARIRARCPLMGDTIIFTRSGRTPIERVGHIDPEVSDGH